MPDISQHSSSSSMERPPEASEAQLAASSPEAPREAQYAKSPEAPRPDVSGEVPGPKVSEREREREREKDQPMGRLVRFGREHPALTVAGLAGAGLLGGLEMAVGVLLGAGVAALIKRPNGHAAAETAREARSRVRQMLDRTPHELRERARAVVLAARGKITPPHEAERATHAQKPEDGPTQGPSA
jgi:hypothetical protein